MKVHFIGIGGIGVSALAQYYSQKGNEVSGSDLVASEMTDFLKNGGVKIFINHFAENISKDTDLVIYSPAVTKDNPEYKKAKELGIKLQSYPEALGELTKKYYTIAVAGAHGKSTVTAMIGLILAKAGLDPTVIVGTKLREFGDSNFRAGRGKHLVIEACEYDGSFLNYQPNIIVVTNVDREHMDYFKTFSNVKKTFKNFVLKLPQDGFLVANRDDPNSNFKLVSNSIELDTKKSEAIFKVKNYSLKQKEAEKIRKILKIPGQHNISNALAALSVARILNINDKVSLKSLSEYQGSWRRFEIKIAELRGISRGKTRKITIVSDYGHHPNEVSATLKAAREKYQNIPSSRANRSSRAKLTTRQWHTTGQRKIWLIFQPHQYQRTHYLFKDFVKLFRKVPIDHIIITDIYDVAGREEKKISSSVSSENLVEKIRKKNVSYMTVGQAEKFVEKNIKSGEVLIIMGAGDVYKLADKF